ncbi:thioesterase [Nocardiopsis gilva YIM 90087]|uniref:Thioesterase n=2 Tax=Nocardiopsis gilva TaxID=280236 RepID=A0A223SE00_9ACTN|nr:thioesterase [Nocardiopsis gilva YIM 90087]
MTAVTEHMTATPVAERPGDEPRRHVYFATIRFADLDPLNHVNNVRMLTYLEDARIALLKWDAPDGDARVGGMVVARHEVDYLRPILLRPEPVRVETWVSEIRNASFRLEYEIVDDDHVYARAASVIVGYDLETQSPRRLDDNERAYLGQYLHPGE